MPAPSAVALVAAALLLPGDPTLVLRLHDARITESSGLAASSRHPGVLWTHNDGGAAAEVMAVGRTGRTVATVRLRGIDPYDPEAIAPGRDPAGRPALFLGDIGDNRLRRPDVSVFRFTEPTRLTDQTVAATWFRLTYPDGPHDAEALLVDPRDGRLWLATKDVFGGGLYRAPAGLRTDRPNRLTRVGDVPGLVTDGAFLPDGRFLLRTYSTVYLYAGPDRPVASAALPETEQGESLAVDGSRLLVGSEGRDSPVYAVAVPTPSTPPTGTGSAGSAGPTGPATRTGQGTAAGTPGPRDAGRGDDRGDGLGDGLGAAGWAVLALGTVLAAAAGLAGVRRRRGRRRHAA